MVPSPDDVGDTLVRTLMTSGPALDVAAELADAALNEVIKYELLESIPLVSMVVRLRSAVGGVREALLARKLLQFVSEFSAIPHEERRRLLEKLEESGKDQREAGEQLLLLLDRAEDMSKAKLMARVLIALLRGKCPASQVWVLLAAIDRAFVPDLKFLVRAGKNNSYPDHVASRLLGAGLVLMTMIPIELEDGRESSPSYKKTTIGILMSTLLHDALL